MYSEKTFLCIPRFSDLRFGRRNTCRNTSCHKGRRGDCSASEKKKIPELWHPFDHGDPSPHGWHKAGRQERKEIQNLCIWAKYEDNGNVRANAIVVASQFSNYVSLQWKKQQVLTILLSSEYGPFQHGMYKILSWLPFFYFFSMREILSPEQSIHDFKNEAKDCFLQTERLMNPF